MIGYEHIRVQSPYPLQHLEQLHIQWKTGEHGRIRLTGTSPDSEQVSAVLQAAADDTLYVYAQQGEQELSLFKGLVQRVEVTHSQGIYTLTIEGVSASYALDVEKRKRTFPEEQQTYSALIGKVLQAYPGSDMIYHTGGGEAVGEPILQYEETDWELLQRLASRLQAVVVCDILEAASPKLHFGMPEGTSRELPQDVSYTARKNLKAYHLAGGLSSGLHDTDFFEYEITTSQRYALGEQVKFRQQPFVIRELRAELEQGELHFHYVLARPDGIRRETLRNPLLRGISLEGEVLAVRGEEVQLRLEIDKDDGLAEPHWYPFAPPTGSAMYCLPQVGTKASLYYPDATGSGALIVGTVRKNGGESAKTSDTNTRYFGTEHGSELKLAPSHVNLQKDPEGAMLVSLNDETGIEITSPGKLTMTAELELELYTPQQIILGSESQILAYRGESEAGLVVESEYHLLGEKVWADGSDRTTYPPFDDEPELGEEPEPDPPFNWGKLVKNVLVGLAVVVAVAAVAALTVATLGAGPILIGAVASGALIGGAMGVGMMAVSDIARGEVSDMSDYALTGLKDSFIGAVSGAIFGPGAAVGTAFARKMGAAGAEGAFTSIMDQLLSGEKINWKTVAMDAGIGMLTLGALDNKYAKQLGGFIGKIGNKISPASIKSGISKGMDKAAAGYQKALEKLSEAGSVLGKKMKDLGQNVADKAKDLNQKAKKLADSIEQQNKLANEKLRQQVQNAAENIFGPKNNYAFAGNTTSPNISNNIPNVPNTTIKNSSVPAKTGSRIITEEEFADLAILLKGQNLSRVMVKELKEGMKNGLYSIEKITKGNAKYKIDVLDSNGKPSTTVLLDDSGKTVSMSWTVGSSGKRGSGYRRAKVGKGNERGHIKSINEGSLDNAVEDSPLNIIPQTPQVNDPKVKTFEYYRVENCQGEKVITDMLDDPPGYVRVSIPSKNIDVVYNPLSQNTTKWPKDWYTKSGPFN
ncbi:contractile injection system protein, VgrG/Pvc8 family [Paenibacillus massiliensis]|uniref:contractile injection system protein, VgrG/Pvc8 family n=1 Tax=Paenibacillus massiliensis TaxID=225917 RepID=UPI00042610D0|nr:contractile injection system protein, VgrG/Pvc8 family [Paenibacillus massiliensis]